MCYVQNILGKVDGNKSLSETHSNTITRMSPQLKLVLFSEGSVQLKRSNCGRSPLEVSVVYMGG